MIDEEVKYLQSLQRTTGLKHHSAQPGSICVFEQVYASNQQRWLLAVRLDAVAMDALCCLADNASC